MKDTRYRQFRQIKDRGMLTVECPDCKGYFGLMARFVEEIGEAIYHYNCPYCGVRHSLKKG